MSGNGSLALIRFYIACYVGMHEVGIKRSAKPFIFIRGDSRLKKTPAKMFKT